MRSLVCPDIQHAIYIYIPAPSSLRAKSFRYKVSIPHPLGFNWDPLEWCWYNYIIYIVCAVYIIIYIYIIKLYHPSLSLPYFPPHWTWQMTCTLIHLSCSKNCDANLIANLIWPQSGHVFNHDLCPARNFHRNSTFFFAVFCGNLFESRGSSLAKSTKPSCTSLVSWWLISCGCFF